MKALNIFCAVAWLFILNASGPTAFAQGTALVGHWPLNGDVNDATGRHGENLVGASFAWVSGAGNEVTGTNALALNPQNQADTYVLVTNAPDLQFGTNDFTISYWVKKLVGTENFLDAYGIGRWDTGAHQGSNAWTLLLNNGINNDEATFAIEGGTNVYSVASPTNLTLNVWHHLMGVRRQSALELYVDGVFVSHQTIPAGTLVNDNPTLDFYIGSSANAGYEADAVYDDVQIYHGAVSNGGVAAGQTAGGQVAFLYARPGQTVGPIESPAGLVAWWPANNNAVDVVGGNNGTLTNDVTYIPGEVNQAFNFSSNSALVLLTNSTALQLQNFTIEAWIKRASLTSVSSDTNAVEGNALMFGYGDSGYSFAIGPDGKLLLTKVDFSDVISPTGVTDTNWHHVAVTTTNGAVTFYVDGVAASMVNYSVNYLFTTPVAIGGRADNLNQNNNDSFLGAIDELSVYKRALSPAEIQSIYQAGEAGKNLADFISAAPTLNIASSGANVTIFWAVPAMDYVLQENTNLAISGGWTNAGYSVTNVNGTNSILVTPTAGSRFFRLSNP